MSATDATVVGSGPNGLAAAVTLARAGLSVTVLEKAPTIGGGLRTLELTLPGFLHDVCSAVHPAALSSPFFLDFELTKRVPFVIPEVSYAHPLDGGRAGVAWHDINRTAEGLGRDGAAWRGLLAPLVDRITAVTAFTGDQLLRIPSSPVAAFLYGLRVLEQGSPLWNARFREDVAPALLAGVAAHGIGPLPALSTAGAGLLLAAHGHARGWGYPVGGSQAMADAMADDIRAHGGSIVVDHEVRSPADVDPSTVTLLDTSPEFLAQYGGDRLPARYLRALSRFRRGSAVAKVDFALSEPVPWTNPEVHAAPTVHLGGTRAEIAAAENAVADGRIPDNPYVLVTQPTIFDSTRAPEGKHILWAYTHVPRDSEFDATELITRQVERFAPGFRDVILASASRSAVEVAAHNPNDIGGEMMGGDVTIAQLVKRPVVSRTPWETPVDGLFLCSASTPPGPSVQGMNGWYAARLALRKHFGLEAPPLH